MSNVYPPRGIPVPPPLPRPTPKPRSLDGSRNELTAEEARKILCTIDISDDVRMICVSIKARAEAGHRDLPHPFQGSQTAQMPTGQKLLVQKFESLGYEYQKHTKPEGCNDPREHDWDELKW